MNRDLHFSAAEYGFGAGIFFLSYAACEIPSNLMLLRFGARKWLSRIMMTWGMVAILMVFVRTPLSFYGARFLLGMAEAGFFPGVMYYLTLWFSRAARARTVSSFYVALPLSGTVVGSLAGWLLSLRGTLGLAGWQWLFLVEGAPAVLLGVLLLCVLPEGPEDTTWLTDQERQWIVGRLRSERGEPSSISGESQGAAGAGHGLAVVLQDRRVWRLGLFEWVTLTVLYAYSFTAPLMLRQATRLTVSEIGWVVAALGVLGAAAMLSIGWLTDRTGRGGAWIALCTTVMAIGCAGVGLERSPGWLLASLGLIVAGFYGMQGPLWALAGSLMSGEAAAGGLALITMLGVGGGFLGPYRLGLSKTWTGDYRWAMFAIAVASLWAIQLVWSVLWPRATGASQQSRTSATLPP